MAKMISMFFCFFLFVLIVMPNPSSSRMLLVKGKWDNAHRQLKCLCFAEPVECPPLECPNGQYTPCCEYCPRCRPV
ncbi:hypothetical protein MKW92_021107 [Papaver armeniacum]|nr:hypothetical protein MKW92_021107 [Papaver armeniacum]